MATSTPVRSLLSQLRIVFDEVQAMPHIAPPANSEMLQHFGLRYAAEMYLCAQGLRAEEAASPTEEPPSSPVTEPSSSLTA